MIWQVRDGTRSHVTENIYKYIFKDGFGAADRFQGARSTGWMSSLGLDEMHGSRKPCLVIGIHLLFPGLADFLDPISHFCSLGVHQANCKRRWFLSCLLYDQRLGLKQNHGLYAVLPFPRSVAHFLHIGNPLCLGVWRLWSVPAKTLKNSWSRSWLQIGRPSLDFHNIRIFERLRKKHCIDFL